MAQVIKRIKIPRGGYTAVFGRWYKLDWFNHSHVYATKIDGDIKISYADTIAKAREEFGLGRKKNPTISTSSLPKNEWVPAHAIRQNSDGTIDVLREKNTGRRANIAEGYMAGGVFHPIRHSADYDSARAGESGKRRKKAKTTRKKAKATAKKRALPISRREYGGDGSRYRNSGSKKTIYTVRRKQYPTLAAAKKEAKYWADYYETVETILVEYANGKDKFVYVKPTRK